MMESVPPFLDVSTLLEASRPRPHVSWTQFLIGGFVLAFFLSWFVGRSSQPAAVQQAFSMLIGVGLAAFAGTMVVAGWIAVRRARMEHAAVGAVEELIQLRRWPEAGLLLQSILSRPTRSPVSRAQSLLYLAMVLARYHRFEDSVAVDDHLLEQIPLDDATEHAVRLARAMSLLREENLLDADRAIAELRRASRGMESAGLALVEMYRDVKTGHPAEAIEMFDSRLTAMRKQLGHRLADAWALAARAYDLLGRSEDAQSAFENATLLAPMVELIRRYPELAPLPRTYKPAAAPDFGEFPWGLSLRVEAGRAAEVA
jgi:tetratricopeptide (TPR) repeat protein